MTTPRFSLRGFTEEEIEILHRHLAYGGCRLERERSDLYHHSLAWPCRPQNQGLSVTPKRRWDLVRARLLSRLARVIEMGEKCASDWWLDLSPLLDDPDTLEFLADELNRSRLGLDYVKTQPFAERTSAYLLRALDVEIRFFGDLLAYVEGLDSLAIRPTYAGVRPSLCTSIISERPAAVYGREEGGC